MLASQTIFSFKYLSFLFRVEDIVQTSSQSNWEKAIHLYTTLYFNNNFYIIGGTSNGDFESNDMNTIARLDATKWSWSLAKGFQYLTLVLNKPSSVDHLRQAGKLNTIRAGLGATLIHSLGVRQRLITFRNLIQSGK